MCQILKIELNEDACTKKSDHVKMTKQIKENWNRTTTVNVTKLNKARMAFLVIHTHWAILDCSPLHRLPEGWPRSINPEGWIPHTAQPQQSISTRDVETKTSHSSLSKHGANLLCYMVSWTVHMWFRLLKACCEAQLSKVNTCVSTAGLCVCLRASADSRLCMKSIPLSIHSRTLPTCWSDGISWHPLASWSKCG